MDDALELLVARLDTSFPTIGTRNGAVTAHSLEHLACFLPGSLALGAKAGAVDAQKAALYLKTAAALADSCFQEYHWTATGGALPRGNCNPLRGGWEPGDILRKHGPGVEINESDTLVKVIPLHGRWEGGSMESIIETVTRACRMNEVSVRFSKVGKECCLAPAGLAPEEFHADPNNASRILSNNLSNQLRPETVESLFHMWWATGEEHWREKGWQIFTAFMLHSRTPQGAFAKTQVGNIISRCEQGFSFRPPFAAARGVS